MDRIDGPHLIICQQWREDRPQGNAGPLRYPISWKLEFLTMGGWRSSRELGTRGRRPCPGIWRTPNKRSKAMPRYLKGSNSLCGQCPEGRRRPQGARGCRRRSGAGRVLSTMAGGGGIEQQTVPSSGRSRQNALWSARNRFLSGGGVGVFVLVCLLAAIGVRKKTNARSWKAALMSGSASPHLDSLNYHWYCLKRNVLSYALEAV